MSALTTMLYADATTALVIIHIPAQTCDVSSAWPLVGDAFAAVEDAPDPEQVQHVWPSPRHLRARPMIRHRALRPHRPQGR